jgi:hypothetical protein
VLQSPAGNNFPFSRAFRPSLCHPSLLCNGHLDTVPGINLPGIEIDHSASCTTNILRAKANAPCYVTNHSLHTEFNIPYVSDVIHERINKHYKNLEAHPNPLLEPPIKPINTRRPKTCWPSDLQGP